MQRYLLGASLQQNFTHVQSSTTAAQLVSARRTIAPENYLTHPNEVPVVNAWDNLSPELLYEVAAQTVIKPSQLQSLGVWCRSWHCLVYDNLITVGNKTQHLPAARGGSYVPYHDHCALSYSDNVDTVWERVGCCKPSYTMPRDFPNKT